MARLNLTCAGCGRRIETEHERRIHVCPFCNAVSHLKPGSHTMFLRLLSSDLADDPTVRRMAGQESDLVNAIQMLRQEETDLRLRYEKDSKRSSATFRILIMNFIIATVAALFIFADFPVRMPSLAPAGIAVALMFFTVILMILQSTNLRSAEYQMGGFAERRQNAQQALRELQRRIDLVIVGSSGLPKVVH
jgi:hypothetical protein